MRATLVKPAGGLPCAHLAVVPGVLDLHQPQPGSDGEIMFMQPARESIRHFFTPGPDLSDLSDEEPARTRRVMP